MGPEVSHWLLERRQLANIIDQVWPQAYLINNIGQHPWPPIYTPLLGVESPSRQLNGVGEASLVARRPMAALILSGVFRLIQECH